MWKKNLLVNKISIILLFLILVCGCEAKKITENKENSVTFTDALGREVSIEKKPERVAALIGGFADIWLLSGGEIVAAPEDAWDDFELPLEKALNIGGAHSPSIETLLSANPDFVIGSASVAEDVKLKDILEKAGITVAYFDVDSFDDYLSMLDICTDITERKDLYEENGIKIKEQIKAVKERLSQINIPQERKFLLLRASSGFVKSKGSEGTVLGEMLRDLGYINIADSDKTLLENLNTESIITKNPYHIFVVVMGDDYEKAVNNLKKMFNDNPAWKTLPAISENRLHIMDKKLFHIKPNDKWGIAYEQLEEILLKTNQ